MIQWHFSNGVYELALGNAPCNEVGTALLADLERFVREVDPERGRALVIYSTVPGGFSAGADLRELYASFAEGAEADHEAGLREFIDRIHGVMNALDTLPMTTIGVVHGVCFGGGFELALTCDLLVAERSARFCFPELRLGIIPGFGGIPRLRREVANPIVRDLLLTGRSINAKRAQTAGLVSQVVPIGEGLRAARMTAAQATKFDREAAAAAKRFIKPIPIDQLAEEKEIFIRLSLRPTMREALRRFVESTDIRPYLP